MNYYKYSDRFSLISICALAISVSLGVALVSISKFLILISLLIATPILIKNIFTNNKIRFISPWIILLSLIWMSLTLLWTSASISDAIIGLSRHARLLVLPIIFLLIKSKKDSKKVLQYLVTGQIFIVICSWFMYFGLALPWAKNDNPTEMGILFSSTLEQPVMSTLALIVFWHMQITIFPKMERWIFWGICTVIIFNVFYVMTGRTGYISMFVAIAVAIWVSSNQRQKFFGAIALVLLALVLSISSTRLQQRVFEVRNDIVGFEKGDLQSSQGMRLDYWQHSLMAIADKPLVGHGVGSWKKQYHRFGGTQIQAPSNPHNQYLLWAVEGGLIGLAFMIGILFALYMDAQKLEIPAKRAMLSTLVIAAVMGLFNCPFFGAGIGEFFLLMFGCFLATNKNNSLKPSLMNDSPPSI